MGRKVVRVGHPGEEIEVICRRQNPSVDDAAEDLRGTENAMASTTRRLEADLQRRRANLQQLLLQGSLRPCSVSAARDCIRPGRTGSYTS